MIFMQCKRCYKIVLQGYMMIEENSSVLIIGLKFYIVKKYQNEIYK